MSTHLNDHELLPIVSFLTSDDLINNYNSGIFYKKNTQELIEIINNTQRKLNKKLPDYIHDNSFKINYNDCININSLFYKSFEILSNRFIMKKHTRIYINSDEFENWQNLLTFINHIPILSYFIYKSKNLELISDIKFSTLPYIKDNILTSQLKKSLSETHIHINGTSEYIYTWQYFLLKKNEAYIFIKESFKKNYKHFNQIGIYNIHSFYTMIVKAKYIQEFIVSYIYNDEKLDFNEWKKYLKNKNFSLNEPFRINKIYLKNIKHPIEHYESNKNLNQLEIIFWLKIFEKLDKMEDENEKNEFTILIHYYYLVQSIFMKLLVQQLDQYGFSQFQLITDNEIRDFYEENGFKERYKQLDSFYDHKLEHLEARFAPKKNMVKFHKLYSKLICDHNEIESSRKLTLIAHFIKKKDQTNNYYLGHRHTILYKELKKQADVIINYFRYTQTKLFNNKFKDQIYNFIGIDGAGNELYTRPEVFAPTFKYLREIFRDEFRKELKFTFHAGEDFIHIISGIRYIFEALIFLDMREYDRIGHATALGIKPKFWREKLNNQLVISKGEWLDNLIFLNNFLNLKNLNKEINKYWKEIYNEDDIPNNILKFKIYLSRSLDPTIDYSKQQKYLNFKISPKIIMYLKKYHNYKVRKEYDKLIIITLSEKFDIYIEKLQNKILAMMKEKKIGIETMITSNIRISYYDFYKDHHILNWLQNPHCPDLLLSSDDPGIFNNNLHIEFSHLFNIIKKTNLDFKSISNILIKNNKIYSE
ncbi:hypothetical protein [Aliarcobacter cryaerophilus]|uniref:hypothetical protein n=1 Tax=Aliarcobacter cryaerophilus TaxID=28198 RepID=UPI00112F1C39|nr:hypothetical protein [Aliarcobacter cryaerophilus]